MDHLLSLSRAARLVGTSRGEIQKQIQAGHLSTFEGHVRESELLKAYPQTDLEKDGYLQHLENIKENAVHKPTRTDALDPEQLAGEVYRLRLKVAELNQELNEHQNFVSQLQVKLANLQRECGHHQKVLLQAVIAWMRHQQKSH